MYRLASTCALLALLCSPAMAGNNAMCMSALQDYSAINQTVIDFAERYPIGKALTPRQNIDNARALTSTVNAMKPRIASVKAIVAMTCPMKHAERVLPELDDMTTAIDRLTVEIAPLANAEPPKDGE